MSEQTSDGFSIGGLFGGINDTFSELAKTYLNVEALKAQTGAIRAQSEYSQLATYNPSYLSSPNAVPLNAQQIAALNAQRAGGLGISTPMLLLGGVALLAVVLLIK